jgi:thiaminase
VACTAYARFVLDVGMQGDLLGLYVALAPCLLGYAEVAKRLKGWEGRREGKDGTKYWRWVENYVAEDYLEAVVKGREVIEREVVRSGVAAGGERLEELVGVFARATRLEVGFWEEGAHTPVGGLAGGSGEDGGKENGGVDRVAE